MEFSETLTGLPSGNIPISNTTDLKVVGADAQSLRMVIGTLLLLLDFWTADSCCWGHGILRLLLEEGAPTPSEVIPAGPLAEPLGGHSSIPSGG